MKIRGMPEGYMLAGTLRIYYIPCNEWITKTTQQQKSYNTMYLKLEHLMLGTSKSTMLRALFKEWCFINILPEGGFVHMALSCLPTVYCFL